MRPCLSVCEDVEQQCPYLLPDQTLSPGEAAHPTPQYAGEPTFLCLDPNIPESTEQRLKSPTGDEDCCYSHCGSPGRGTQVKDNIEAEGGILSLCEHCPGRPSNSTIAPSSGSASSRTIINKVFIIWTAVGSVALLQTDRLIYLLVMCEYSVVRTMYWFSNERRRHSCL
ncbi:hypothetical protein JTB14_010545 [Gonioctena quinquepunctata]|nr:hypothetical protein JTB14_010545 [Gonioctena quinquepunctata]